MVPPLRLRMLRLHGRRSAQDDLLLGDEDWLGRPVDFGER